MPAKLPEKEKKELIERYSRGASVTALCKEKKISRVVFYRWLKQYKSTEEKKATVTINRKLSPEKRLEIITRVQAGEKVKQLCKSYGISRTIFYRLKKRYHAAPDEKKLDALANKKPVIKRYHKQAPIAYEQAVLNAVTLYPELSSHKLVHVLPAIQNKPILGNHGVANVLKRHNLSTYEKRLAYVTAEKNSYVLPLPDFYWFKELLTINTPLVKNRLFHLGIVIIAAIFSSIVFLGARALFNVTFLSTTTINYVMILPLLSLSAGMIFFLYSIKHYLSIAMVLGSDTKQSGGLLENLSHIQLQRRPFVSVHLAMYNERRVIERLLTAVTSFAYDDYEILVADDSTDPQAIAALEKWKHHPKVKILHRDTREGYKGQALQHALEHTDKRAEFIVIFDSDFIPYPDTIVQFLKYFQSVCGNSDTDKNIAAIQGYQWHVLNKSENWLTRGIRSEYAGSYVVERSSIEMYQGLKQISGSVCMLRKDILQEIGWGKSITEDFELTLKLYEKGYKVVYTPYVQAPAEAVSTLKRFIRQRMRWAEGHSYNVKKMFLKLLYSSKLSVSEKCEFVYLAPYYLQAAVFLFGTCCWFISESILNIRLPFWTEVWGWSLILTNIISLPLVNMVGLFLEEAEEKDYLGILSFLALSYIIVPFQAYASIKGFIEKKEGPWFRTPKTGKITDVFTPRTFYHYIKRFFGRQFTLALSNVSGFSNQYLALATANNKFDSFTIHKKQVKGLGKILLSFLIIFSLVMTSLAVRVPYTQAAGNQLFLLSTLADGTNNYPSVALSKKLHPTANSSPTVNTVTCTQYAKAVAGTTEMFYPTAAACGATQTSEAAGGKGWFMSAQSGQYPSGSWTFTTTLDSSVVGTTKGDFMLFAVVYVYNGSTYTRKFYSIYKSTSQGCSVTRPARTTGTAIIPSTTNTDYTWTCTSAPVVDLGVNQYLYVEYFIEINTASGSTTANVSMQHNGNAANAGDSSVTTTTFAVPESGLLLLPIVPFIPKMLQKGRTIVASQRKRKKQKKRL